MSHNFISGCAGTVLSDEERGFFRDADPWGFILFKRNCDTAEQIKALVQDLRDAVGWPAPVLIDQEGGRVQRLQPPLWPAYPKGADYGAVWRKHRARGRRAVHLGMRLIADDLTALGIDVDCVPVVDIPVAGAHEVIGGRAYGFDADIVTDLGRAAAEGLMAGGVLPVVKHMPGHGRANVDSHKALPRVSATRAELAASDWLPFKALADLPFAMSAHLVFEALDPERPATTSAAVIAEVIRGAIGFDGLLMTDDLSMQALAGTIGERARRALDAGCDIVLHCNGEMADMRAVAAESRRLDGRAAERAAAGLKRRRASEPFDRAEAWREFQGLMADAVG